MLRLTAPIPRARPIPITPPTAAWAVETGSPIFEATRTVVAVAKFTAKPHVLLKAVIFLPMVSMTR
jgi:hypothetical protein